MGRPARTGRALLVVAAGFLALDGILLILAGLWSGRRVLLVWGGLLLLLGLAVAASWRWYRARLDDIADAQASLRREREALRDLIRR